MTHPPRARTASLLAKDSLPGSLAPSLLLPFSLPKGFHMAETIEEVAIMSLEAGMDMDLGGVRRFLAHFPPVLLL